MKHKVADKITYIQQRIESLSENIDDLLAAVVVLKDNPNMGIIDKLAKELEKLKTIHKDIKNDMEVVKCFAPLETDYITEE